MPDTGSSFYIDQLEQTLIVYSTLLKERHPDWDEFECRDTARLFMWVQASGGKKPDSRLFADPNDRARILAAPPASPPSDRDGGEPVSSSRTAEIPA